MEEPRLDNELNRLHTKLHFLWDRHNFHVKYMTRNYGIYDSGFIIGLENDTCKLIFEKESNSRVEQIKRYIGLKSALFVPPNHAYYAKYGWYPLTGLVQLITGVEFDSVKDDEKDLENLAQYLNLYMNNLLELLKYPEELDQKILYYQNFYKEQQVSVEKIKEERARLHALGLDSSLEAAITSLRGDKHE